RESEAPAEQAFGSAGASPSRLAAQKVRGSCARRREVRAMSRVPVRTLFLVLYLSSIALAQAPTPADPAYVGWLEERSLLTQARRQALSLSGRGEQWRFRYGDPQPRAAVRRASVWLLDYAGSVIP